MILFKSGLKKVIEPFSKKLFCKNTKYLSITVVILLVFTGILLTMTNVRLAPMNYKILPNRLDIPDKLNMLEEPKEDLSNNPCAPYQFSAQYMFKTRAGGDYSFKIECDNNSHITNGGDPTGYIITITNTGNFFDTITLTDTIENVTGGTEPDPAEWSTYLSKYQITLGPDESDGVFLNVSTSCGCQLDTVAQIRVTGTSVNQPSFAAYVDTFTTRGQEYGLVELEPPSNLLFSDFSAGQWINFSLYIKNPLTASQELTITNLKRPPNWIVEYETYPIEVPAYSRSEFKVRTKVPLENNPGEYALRFDATSIYDPYISSSVKIPITIYPELAIKSIKISPDSPKPGDAVDVRVDVENLGPALAKNVYINIYDNDDRLSEHLLGQFKIDQLLGNSGDSFNFTWEPDSAGIFNLTAYANPSQLIQEVGNRYFNNLKSKSILVQYPSHDGHGSNGENGNTTNLGIISDDGLYIIIGIIVIIVVLLLVLFFKKRRSNELNAPNASKYEERTAKKVPLQSFFSKGSRDTRGIKSSESNYGRTARKERLSGSSKGKGKEKSRNRRRGTRSGTRNRKYRRDGKYR